AAGWATGLDKIAKTSVVIAGAVKAFSILSDAVVDAIQNADTYQKNISNIATITDRASVNIGDLSSAILALNPALGDASELSDAFYQAFSSGATSVQEATDIVTTAAKFGKGVLTDTKTSVDVLTTAVNAYGKENMTASKAADLFFVAIKDGKIEGDQLASSIGRSIPVFANAGISLDQLSAGVATLTQVGVSAPESMTQLNAVVNAFIKPSAAMIVELNKIGYVSGAAFIKAKGLTG